MNLKNTYRPFLKPIRGALRRLRKTRNKATLVAADPANEFPKKDIFTYRSPDFLDADGAFAQGESIDNLGIVERVVKAYKGGFHHLSKPSAVWEVIYNAHQAPLHQILISGEIKMIENLLTDPARSNIFYGFDETAAHFIQNIKNNSLEYRESVLRYKDSLVRVAEVMGAIRLQHPNWGAYDLGLKSADEILDKIDQFLGVKLTYPNPFPNEFGIKTQRGVLSHRVPQAVYQAWRIRELTRGIPNPRILEIGGGLGRTAFYAWQLGMRDYTIIDLPFTGVSQGYFLLRTLGEENITLQGESGSSLSRRIKLFQPAAFLEEASDYDLIINADSITEMSRTEALRYWHHIQQHTPIFLSINHEVNPFTVHEIAEECGSNIVSYSRNAYPIRKGYIEEIFQFRQIQS